MSPSPRPPSIAWYLVPPYLALLVYASLYPFLDWRFEGVDGTWLLRQPMARLRWLDADVWMNVLGYMPLGFLLALGLLRTLRSANVARLLACVLVATIACAMWSLGMETLQTLLPRRVPSSRDLLTNAIGGALGASLALVLDRAGVLGHWQAWRSRWLQPNAQAEVALLVSWPFALLSPSAVPLGLGQVSERLLLSLKHWGVDLQLFLDAQEPVALSSLSPVGAVVCTALGLLLPALLSHLAIRTVAQRLLALAGLVFVGWLALTLSSVLSFGPKHAWAWWSLGVQTGWVLGLSIALACIWLKPTALAIGCAMVVVCLLTVLNQASSSAYFWQTLQTWEQGRFIQFHGVSQWLGWLWPYAALLVALSRVLDRPTN